MPREISTFSPFNSLTIFLTRDPLIPTHAPTGTPSQPPTALPTGTPTGGPTLTPTNEPTSNLLLTEQQVTTYFNWVLIIIAIAFLLIIFLGCCCANYIQKNQLFRVNALVKFCACFYMNL